MDEEDIPVNKIKHRVKVAVDGIGGFWWLFLLGLIFLICYDGEIRCSLGNKIECAKMDVKPK